MKIKTLKHYYYEGIRYYNNPENILSKISKCFSIPVVMTTLIDYC